MPAIVITGFMGTGKTEVGERLARRLGVPFVDLDRWIAARTGRDIPDIFGRDGEAAFRALEREAVGTLADGEAGPEMVLATGGGTVTQEGLLERLRAVGPVVNLTARPDTVLDRLARNDAAGLAARPLLDAAAQPRDAIADLMHRRAAAYARADVQVETDGRRPDEVVERVLSAVGWAPPADAPTKSEDVVQVALGARSYPVLLGRPLGDLAAALREVWGERRLALVIDDRVMSLHGVALVHALRPHSVHAVPAGERSKSLRRAGMLWNELIAAGHDRASAVVAVGGGVTGDLAGFVAAGFMRGVRWAQVPTTLLAQVDSAVGGKTGVNVGAHKNMVGAFHQPSLVFVAPKVLATVSDRDYRSGLAEVVKYGVIGDAGLFAFLEAEAAAVLAREPEALALVTRRSVQRKAAVVASDERESGPRALLNFGHTVGHALEGLAARRGAAHRLRHGEAVALGMIAAARVSRAAGTCGPDVESRITALLARLGLPIDLDGQPELPEALEHLGRDKKAVTGPDGATGINFVCVERVGRALLARLTPAAVGSAVLRTGARRNP